MARHNFLEIVLMALAVLGGLGILLLIGTRSIHVTASSTTPGTGGVSFFAGGVSVNLLAMLIVAIAAIIVSVAIFLWKR
jgi:hypothetical protein